MELDYPRPMAPPCVNIHAEHEDYELSKKWVSALGCESNREIVSFRFVSFRFVSFVRAFVRAVRLPSGI